ncbi:MAG: hypothetical protein R3C11_24385 [Planctomycetaceae bacterium]
MHSYTNSTTPLAAVLKTSNLLPEVFEIGATVTALDRSGYWLDGFLVFDFQDINDFKYAGFLAGQNKWLIGHYQGNFNNTVAVTSWTGSGRRILAETPYDLHVRIDGSRAYLSVDGELIAQGDFGTPLNHGGVGMATRSAQSLFDNFAFDTRVDRGAVNDLPYREDFEDGTADKFMFTKASRWSIVNSYGQKKLLFNGANNGGLGIARIDFDWPLPNKYELATTLTTFSGANRWLDGFLVFDYQSPTDFKYAGVFTGQNQWVIGHYKGDWNNHLAVVDWDDIGVAVKPNRPYTIHLSVDHDQVDLKVDGISILNVTFAEGINNGEVGLAAYNAVTQFDGVEVALSTSYGKGLSLPYYEDFSDGQANNLYYDKTSTWAVISSGAEKIFRVNNSYNNQVGLSYLALPEDAPSAFEVSARIKSIQTSAGQRNGFLIFDYKNDRDFKYAGMLVDENQWVIGHYQGDWNNRIAQVDWDDFGRSINSNQNYTFHLRIDGDLARLSVDGYLIVSADFGIPINTRGVGMAVGAAFTWYDNFQVAERVDSGAPVYLPYHEDFNENNAGVFHAPQAADWSVSGNQLQIDMSGGKGTGILLADLARLFPVTSTSLWR